MRSPVYEQEFARQGLEFKYIEKFPLREVNAEAGLRNQARLLKPLDDELVRQYAAAVRDGSEFPALTLNAVGGRRPVPVDGNHTLAAYVAAGRKTHDAYVLAIKEPLVLDRITWSFNNHVNGRRLDPEEALQHAVDFCRRYGMAAREAAKEWGVREHAVTRALRVQELRDLLARHNARPGRGLTDERVFELAPLHKVGEDVFVKAAEVVGGSGLSAEQTKELVKEVHGARTQADKLKAVEAFAASEEVARARAQTKNGTVKPRRPLPSDEFALLLGRLVRLFETYPDHRHSLRPTGEKYKQSRVHAEDVCDYLIALYGLGRRLDRTGKEVG